MINLRTLKVRHSLALASALIWLAYSVPYVLSQEEKKSTSGTAVSEKSFGTPQQAADALIQAAQNYDVAALDQILGPAGHDLIDTGEPVKDKQDAQSFAATAQEKNSIAIDPKTPTTATLLIGKEDWPTPILIVQKNGKWSFDAKTGRREILYRRIGSNELTMIQLLHGYVEAQREYSVEQHDSSGINEYAQRIISTPGKQDGLAWQNADGTWDGPVGEEVAKALQEGYSLKSEPYHGYRFKTLKGQGAAAPLGRMSYIVNGYMIGGYGLVAVPAEFGVSGINTFIVSNDGIVYEKILGPNGGSIVEKMDVYNPDNTWTPAK